MNSTPSPTVIPAVEARPGCGFVHRAILVALAILPAGCSVSPYGVFPGLERLPRGTEPLPPSFWETAEKHEGGRSDGRFLFPAPGYHSAWEFTVDDDADTARFKASRTYAPFIGLPFYQGVEERVYTRDGGAARNRARWTPFFAHARPEGWPDGEPRSDVFGVPLFFTVFRDYGASPGARVDGWQTIWTLGPSFMRFESRSPHMEGHGWMAHPLTAAGLGGLLWASYCVTEGDGFTSGHGPLFGLLGWFQSADRAEPSRFLRRPEARTRVFRTLVGGALWWSFESMTDDGVAMDSTHGPLWGMFGVGTWDGEPILRFFWIPIWY